jgi:hypothetical protein
MTQTELNTKVDQYLGLKERQKALNAQVEAAKKFLMGFDGRETDRFLLAVQATPVERVVDKETLIDALGLEVVEKKGLLRETISYFLRITGK